jgi:VanZ family protein
MKQLLILLNRWLPPILWATLIFFLSSRSDLPHLPQTTSEFVFKKTAHLCVYAILYFLTWRALHLTTHRHTHPKIYALALLLVVLYAISDEYHQTFTSGRTPTVRDVGFDTLGALVSLGLIYTKHLTT